MNLKERITEDMKAAMRAKDAARLSAIRMLQAAIKQKEVDERIVADDGAVLAIVEKLIKQRKDSIEQFGKAGRTDLVDKETAELQLLAAIKQKEVDERVVVDDAGVMAIIEKLIKQRKDSIEQFGKAGRDDLVQKETAELQLLQGYLPQPLDEAAVLQAIDAAIAEVAGGAPLAASAMGKVMALLKPRLAGRADMSRVSGLVKARIAG